MQFSVERMSGFEGAAQLGSQWRSVLKEGSLRGEIARGYNCYYFILLLQLLLFQLLQLFQLLLLLHTTATTTSLLRGVLGRSFAKSQENAAPPPFWGYPLKLPLRSL